MSDAQEALEDIGEISCTEHLDSFAHNHFPTIKRALRLLAAVEAGTHKVVPKEDDNFEWYLTAMEHKPYSLIELVKDRLWAVQENSFKKVNEANEEFFYERFSNKETAYFCAKCKTAEFLRKAMLQAAPDFFGEDGK